MKACGDIAWPALREIIDTGAEESKVEQLRRAASSVDGVRSVHDLRTRFVGSCIAVDLHIVVDPDITVIQGHRIGDEVEARIKAEVSEVCDVLVHLDPSDDL